MDFFPLCTENDCIGDHKQQEKVKRPGGEGGGTFRTGGKFAREIDGKRESDDREGIYR